MFRIGENESVDEILDNLVRAYDTNNPLWNTRQRREQALKRFHKDYTSFLGLQINRKRSKHAVLAILNKKGVENPLKFFDMLFKGIQGENHAYSLEHEIGVWTDSFYLTKKRTDLSGLTAKYLK